MISEDPSLAELVQLGIDSALSGMFKAGPGNVTSYDPITNTAFVKPATKHASYAADGTRTYESLEEIPFVPVIFPRAGGMVMRLPMQPGDTVLLVYCDDSLAEWREGGGVSEPQDARRHSVGWPVAIPGFFPDTSTMSPIDAAASSSQAIFGADGGVQVRVGPDSIELAPAGVTPTSFVALATPTDTALADIASKLQALVTAFNSHTHVAPTGGGPTAPPPTPATPPSTPATTASAKTRAL